MITSRTPVSLDGPGARDGDDFVLVAVRAGLDPPHQNNRNSSLSIPRIES